MIMVGNLAFDSHEPQESLQIEIRLHDRWRLRRAWSAHTDSYVGMARWFFDLVVRLWHRRAGLCDPMDCAS